MPGETRKLSFKVENKGLLDLSKYETNPARDVITRYLEKNKGRELVRIFELYQKMSRSSRNKLLKYANSLAR